MENYLAQRLRDSRLISLNHPDSLKPPSLLLPLYSHLCAVCNEAEWWHRRTEKPQCFSVTEKSGKMLNQLGAGLGRKGGKGMISLSPPFSERTQEQCANIINYIKFNYSSCWLIDNFSVTRLCGWCLGWSQKKPLMLNNHGLLGFNVVVILDRLLSYQ